MSDAGSGMSVIGHSLELLLCLGVDLRDIGLLQVLPLSQPRPRPRSVLIISPFFPLCFSTT
jgi:hypothetical protein